MLPETFGRWSPVKVLVRLKVHSWSGELEASQEVRTSHRLLQKASAVLDSRADTCQLPCSRKLQAGIVQTSSSANDLVSKRAQPDTRE